MWLAYTQPTVLTKAWKMNGLAFENVNYREIQLTPGAEKKTLQYLRLRRRGGTCVCADTEAHKFGRPRKNARTHTNRGTIKH